MWMDCFENYGIVWEQWHNLSSKSLYCSTFARFSFQLFREVFLESITHETAPWMKCRCCSWHLEVAATHSLIRRKKLKQQEVLWPRLAGFSKAPQQFFETTTSFTALISPLPYIFAHTLRNYRVINDHEQLYFMISVWRLNTLPDIQRCTRIL